MPSACSASSNSLSASNWTSSTARAFFLLFFLRFFLLLVAALAIKFTPFPGNCPLHRGTGPNLSSVAPAKLCRAVCVKFGTFKRLCVRLVPLEGCRTFPAQTERSVISLPVGRYLQARLGGDLSRSSEKILRPALQKACPG